MDTIEEPSRKRGQLDQAADEDIEVHALKKGGILSAPIVRRKFLPLEGKKKQ